MTKFRFGRFKIGRHTKAYDFQLGYDKGTGTYIEGRTEIVGG